MQQTQFIGGRLWGELDTSVVPPGRKQAHDGAAWFAGRTVAAQGRARPGHAGSPTGLRDRARGSYFIYPALQVTPSGNGAMVGTLTGAKRFPSAAYATDPAGPGRSSRRSQVAAEGTTNYDPKAERWGDYSWAILAPKAKAGLARDRVRAAEVQPDRRRQARLGHAGVRGADRLSAADPA